MFKLMSMIFRSWRC